MSPSEARWVRVFAWTTRMQRRQHVGGDTFTSCPCTEDGWTGACAHCRLGSHAECMQPPDEQRPEMPAAFILGPSGFPTGHKVPTSGMPIPACVYETRVTHHRPACTCTCHTTGLPDSTPTLAVSAYARDHLGTPSLLGALA